VELIKIFYYRLYPTGFILMQKNSPVTPEVLGNFNILYNIHIQSGMLQRTNAKAESFYKWNQDATTNAEEYYRPTQRARAHDVSGLTALIRASFTHHLCFRL